MVMKNARLITGSVATLAVVAALWLWFIDREPKPGSQPSPLPVERETARATDNEPAATNALEAAAGQPRPARGESVNAASRAAASERLVEEICGPDAYNRLRELAQGGPLSRAECETLYQLLQTKTTDAKLERMAGIKNAVMNVLARQQNLPARWDNLLRRMLEDDDQHTVIRDYALQHLFAWYEENLDGRGTAKLKEGERNELQQLFWSILDKKQAGFGGTALLGLYHLAVCDPSVDPARLSEEAVELLRAPDASPLVQISAFQVCGLLGERRALTQAIEAAQNGQNIALRVSAIAAVGALGGRDGLVVLRSLLREANPSVRTAVRTAIKRLEPGTNG